MTEGQIWCVWDEVLCILSHGEWDQDGTERGSSVSLAQDECAKVSRLDMIAVEFLKKGGKSAAD